MKRSMVEIPNKETPNPKNKLLLRESKEWERERREREGLAKSGREGRETELQLF